MRSVAIVAAAIGAAADAHFVDDVASAVHTKHTDLPATVRDGSHFLDEVTAALGAKHGDLPATVRDDVAFHAAGAVAADAKVLAHDLECPRDYTACPSTWTDSGDSTTCLAPANVHAMCGAEVSFEGMTPQEKSSLAHSCGGAVFPCAGAGSFLASNDRSHFLDEVTAALGAKHGDLPATVRDDVAFHAASAVAADAKVLAHDLECPRDYTACPSTWTDSGDSTTCLAPANVHAMCGAEVSFEGMTPQEKSSLAHSCGGAVFPCARN